MRRKVNMFMVVGCAFAVGLSSVQAQSSCEVQRLTSADEAVGDQFGTSVSYYRQNSFKRAVSDLHFS